MQTPHCEVKNIVKLYSGSVVESAVIIGFIAHDNIIITIIIGVHVVDLGRGISRQVLGGLGVGRQVELTTSSYDLLGEVLNLAKPTIAVLSYRLQ